MQRLLIPSAKSTALFVILSGSVCPSPIQSVFVARLNRFGFGAEGVCGPGKFKYLFWLWSDEGVGATEAGILACGVCSRFLKSLDVRSWNLGDGMAQGSWRCGFTLEVPRHGTLVTFPEVTPGDFRVRIRLPTIFNPPHLVQLLAVFCQERAESRTSPEARS